MTELIRFHEKARKHFLLQNLQKYQKKNGRDITYIRIWGMGVTQEWVRYFNICFLRRIWKQKIDPKKQTFAHSVTGRLYCMIISCHLSYTVQWINLLYPSKILKLYQDIKTPQRYDNSGIIACAFLVLVIFCGTDHIGSSMSTVLLKIALKHIRMVDQGANKESSEVIDILLPVTFLF